MFENNGVGAKILNGARRMAELVDQHKMVQDVNKKVTDPLRTDLAPAAREVIVRDGAGEGIVHNIGSTAVPQVVIALVDERGTIRTTLLPLA